MSISRFLSVVALVVSTATGCVVESSGDNCDPCDSDSDCDAGRTCSPFEGGEWLCADEGTTECMVTTYT